MKELKTSRLHIRGFEPRDWKDLYEYLSDERVIRYEPYDTFTEEECRREAMKRSSNGDFLAVCMKDTGKVVGNLYFSKAEYDTWELGYVFNADYQGMGYATEGARAILDEAFKNMGVRRVIAMCNPENEQSWKLLERLGFRREGHLRENIYFTKDESGEPIWQDTYEYGILAKEWLKKEAELR